MLQTSYTAQKSSFPLRISSVNVTKSSWKSGFVTFTKELRNEKLHFLCSVNNHGMLATVINKKILNIYNRMIPVYM